MRETENPNKDSTHIKIPTLNIAVSKQRKLHFMSICKRPGMKINSKFSKVIQSAIVVTFSIKSLNVFLQTNIKNTWLENLALFPYN